MKSKLSSIIGYLMKFISLIAVLAILVLAFGIEYYAISEVIDTMFKIFKTSTGEERVLETALKALDMVLLGVIFFAIAASLFELFVHRISNLPKWLVIEDLDDLKELMIKMIIMVMSISFTGKVITWKEGNDILYLGIGLAVVICALSYFLLVKNDTKKDG